MSYQPVKSTLDVRLARHHDEFRTRCRHSCLAHVSHIADVLQSCAEDPGGAIRLSIRGGNPVDWCGSRPFGKRE